VGLGTQVAALHSFTDAWLSSPVYASTETTVSFACIWTPGDCVVALIPPSGASEWRPIK